MEKETYSQSVDSIKLSESNLGFYGDLVIYSLIFAIVGIGIFFIILSILDQISVSKKR